MEDKLNYRKTETIMFTRRRSQVIQNIIVNNEIIQWSQNIKYLGLILDCYLIFYGQINKLIQRAIASLISMYPLNKLLIYKVVISALT